MKTFLRLGRWCHPTSDHYKNKCDQLYKMALANSDSCSVSHYNLLEKPNVKKDPPKEKNTFDAIITALSPY